ncbi:MAG TPA: DUF2231 domain-containing protein [Sphingobacteriaceae bacterium]
MHFPIALLVTATVIGMVTLFLRPEKKRFMQNLCVILLLLGTIGSWVSIYTGSLADGIVARNLCDPTVLKDHEIAAYTLAYLYSSAAAIYVLILFTSLKNWLRNGLQYLTIFLMVIGLGYLVYTSHLGASLVYEQGAGVNKPSADCNGFQ